MCFLVFFPGGGCLKKRDFNSPVLHVLILIHVVLQLGKPGKKLQYKCSFILTCHVWQRIPECLGEASGVTDDAVTCCAVSILSFSMSSIWKPFRNTSSVEAGTVAVKGDCKDRDDKLHKSSMGSCKAKQDFSSKYYPQVPTGRKLNGETRRAVAAMGVL